MFQLAKTALLSGFFVSHRLFCSRVPQLIGILAFRTTIIEDTHLTLAAIPFNVEANNSLIFLLLQTYEKNLAEFPFFFSFIIIMLQPMSLLWNSVKMESYYSEWKQQTILIILQNIMMVCILPSYSHHLLTIQFVCSTRLRFCIMYSAVCLIRALLIQKSC